MRRRYVSLFCLSLLFLTSPLFSAPKEEAKESPSPNTQTIRASRIELTDSKGNVRILLGCEDKGEEEQPYITLLDTRGNNRARFKLTAGGQGFLAYLDAEGEPQVGLMILPDGISVLQLMSGKSGSISLQAAKDGNLIRLTGTSDKPTLIIADGKSGPGVIVFGKDDDSAGLLGVVDGHPSLSLLAANGNTVASLSAGDHGVATLGLFSPKTKSRLCLDLDDGLPKLQSYDQDGHLRSEWSLDSKGAPSLSFFAKDETLRAKLALEKDRPRFSLTGKDKEVLFSAPSK